MSELRLLAASLSHRGPDGEGFYQHRNTSLAHRRLSIIDLDGGAQPICDQNASVHIVCNGEIYNYQTLQRLLAKHGISTKTRSDTEVALHLYKLFGLQFTQYLEGMYAIAIYDQKTEDLILARDPVGIKPLYISQTPSGIAFASEPKAFIASGWCTASSNLDALPEFLNRQYVSGRNTLFKGIQRLLPGELLRIRKGKILEQRKSELPLQSPMEISETNALEKIDHLLNASVKRHIQSDVPYGAFLSGGIDSSSLVYAMNTMCDATTNTFTIGFDSTSVSDEREQAAQMAATLKTNHKTLSFNETDFWKFIVEMCRSLDDLVADYASLPTLKLAEAASNDVKVILVGEGGDEIFAGYNRYRRGGFLDRLRGRTFCGRGDASSFGFLFNNKEVANWALSSRDHHFRPSLTRVQQYQAHDIDTWLPDNLLLKVDRCLMRYGVEGRVPFLDPAFATFAFALPDKLKIDGRRSKYALKKWLEHKHPHYDVWQKKKGFTVPIRQWLSTRQNELIEYLVANPAIEDAANLVHLKSWLEKPLDKKGAKILFNLLCYALWHDIHIDGRDFTSHSLFH